MEFFLKASLNHGSVQNNAKKNIFVLMDRWGKSVLPQPDILSIDPFIWSS